MLAKKKVIAIVTVLAILTGVLSLQIFKRAIFRITSEFYNPFFSPVSNAENYSLKQSLRLKNKAELIHELLKLQNINEKKSAELQLLQSVQNDKNRLEELLKIKPAPAYKCIFAEIFLRDPGAWYESFSVNKGSASEIEPGCIVLCRIPENMNNGYSFAVVGKISEVSENISQIQTIVSRNCKLSVILKQADAAGILSGGTIKNGKPEVTVSYLPTFKTYQSGEEVFTSGLCTNEDIKAGKLEERHSTPGGLFVGTIPGKVKIVKKLNAEAQLIPAVDLDSLRYIIILVKDKKIIKTK